MKSYMIELSEFLSKEQLQLVEDLFNWLMQPCLSKFRISYLFDIYCQPQMYGQQQNPKHQNWMMVNKLRLTNIFLQYKPFKTKYILSNRTQLIDTVVYLSLIHISEPRDQRGSRMPSSA